MHFLRNTAALTLGLFGASQALEATILADTNRDGKVDAAGKSDHAGRDSWNESSGAIFLANIGDSDRRCSSKIPQDPPSYDVAVDYNLCNDATGDIQRNPKYLAPVLTLPIPTISDSATGSVVVVDKTAASKVRVFLKDGARWNYVASNYTFTAEQLRQGLSLGVDAREVRTADWDGRATLRFSVKDQGAEAQDSVAMRVAPVLTHHHSQLAEQVFVTDPKGFTVFPDSENVFADDLAKVLTEVGMKKPLYRVNVTDTWTQDFFEAGYTTMPGPEGPLVLRVMIASAQKRFDAYHWLFREMRSDTVGAVLHSTYGHTTDSTGNLETVPPYSLNGKSYPAGRTVMGSQFGEKPEMVKFLDAQEVQAPIEIDTTWLEVGHTDEFMQFLPAKSERGWVMMVDDPLAGLALLQEAQKSGNGKVRALSRAKLSTDWADTCLPTDSIDDVLSRANFTEIQQYCYDSIKANIDILKRETGITDREIIRVPALFHPRNNTLRCDPPRNYTYWTPGAPIQEEWKAKGKEQQDPRRLSVLEAAGPRPASTIAKRDAAEALQVGAFYPGCINGVVLSSTEYLAPNPWGPVIDGKDILAAAVNAAYAKANYTVHYMDDWFSHHVQSGEVHCGTNVLRETSAKWW
ncbi:hypothetical protein V2A60_009291 [Cordyceps javanica]